MAARLKLVIAYDGAPFSGWQSQPNGNAIQDHLENAFERICSHPVRVHGAGRTDAGVHALAQVAHVDLPGQRYAPDRWRSALNGVLPPAIRIMRCQFVASAFHARFSAKGKVYRYRIWNAEVLPPLEYGRAWHVRERLNRTQFAESARLFVGRHDFSSFAANRGRAVDDSIRTIHRASVRSSSSLITVEFDGDGFLYRMIRMMVGALVRVGIGRARPVEIRSRLTQKVQAVGLRRTVAPAGGLFLIRVRY